MNTKQDFKFESATSVDLSLDNKIKRDNHNNNIAESKWKRNIRLSAFVVTFYMSLGYLGFISFVVWKYMENNPHDSTAMIAILTTTTATVLGLPAIALRGIFNDNNKDL
jgi:hypothetical protein